MLCAYTRPRNQVVIGPLVVKFTIGHELMTELF